VIKSHFLEARIKGMDMDNIPALNKEPSYGVYGTSERQRSKVEEHLRQ
jgi:hypothetical protein